MKILLFIVTFLQLQSLIIGHSVSKRISKFKSYEIVTPVEYVPSTTRRHLGFSPTASFSFSGYGEKFVLKLSQKKHFLTEDYFHEIQRFDSNGDLIEQIKETTIPGNCFYEGIVNDNPNSNAAISTCQGLKGVILHPDGFEYMIEPVDGEKRSEGSHILYRLRDVDHNLSSFCGHDDDTHTATIFSSLSPATHSKSTTSRSPTARALKTVEVFIVNDKLRFDQTGLNTEQNTADIINIVDSIYSSTNFGDSNTYRVSLQRQVTWRFGDPISPAMIGSEVNVESLLSLFNQWTSLNPPGPVSYAAQFDNHHLLSGYDFKDSILGLAGLGTMCSGLSSGGIDQTLNQASDAHAATVVAHEMGHNFNMTHDGIRGTETESCPAEINVMTAVVCGSCSPLKEFSTCSTNSLRRFCSITGCDCLDNTPPGPWEPFCGNGLRDGNEECDCGMLIPFPNGSYPESCAGRDPCCLPDCTLAPGMQCSAMDACCTGSCTLITNTNTMCRSSRGECDVSETCNGVNSTCPADRYFSPSKTCGGGSGNCYHGACIDLNARCKERGYVQFCEYSLSQTGGNPCGDIVCSDSTGLTCTNIGIVTPNGAPCGVERICYQGRCVNPGVVGGLPCVPATCDSYPGKCGSIRTGCDDTSTITCNCPSGLPCNQGSCSTGLNGCFIATAAYGSETHVNVWILRQFRDTWMKGTYLGELFIHNYYTYSPAVADWISHNEFAKQVTRFLLQPIIFLVQNLFL